MTADSNSWTWKGREIATPGDVISALSGLASREEAEQFMAAYRSVEPAAAENVGYLLGHMDDAAADRLMEWCGVEHPWFGKERPTPTEAFAMGELRGRSETL